MSDQPMTFDPDVEAWFTASARPAAAALRCLVVAWCDLMDRT
jgi:hypothetical protein